jgi:hypothetical protein
MAINYTDIFHSKALQNIPNLDVLVWKYTNWQPWVGLASVSPFLRQTGFSTKMYSYLPEIGVCQMVNLFAYQSSQFF